MDGTFIKELENVVAGRMPFIMVKDPQGKERLLVKDNDQYRELGEKDAFPKIDPLAFNDLASLAAIINTEKTQLVPKGAYYVKIDTQDTISVISDLMDDKKRRNTPYTAKALYPNHNFGNNLDYEQFVIWLRSCFVATPERDELVKLIAGIVHADTVEMKDDGMSQSVVASMKTKSVNGEVKSIVKLRPYRTFVECEQPESEFLFRIQGNGTRFALHEADGGKWKITAKQNIKAFLDKVIKKDNGVVVLL